MPLFEEDFTALYDYPLAKKGINLHVSGNDLVPEEALLTRNLFWRNGMIKRTGYIKLSEDEVASGKRVTSLHRFYFGENGRQLLAAAGTVIRQFDGASWVDISTGLTDSRQVLMETWGALDQVYMANGIDSPSSWNGSLLSPLTGLVGKVVQFLSYQDRLLYISDDTADIGGLGWSGSYEDSVWEAPNSTGVRPDTRLFGMIIHAAQSSDAGINTRVLLAGASGMFLFFGTDLAPVGLGGDYRIDALATNVGCVSPLTMAWTPAGTMYLGSDKMVYLLPFEALTPIPIGRKIFSTSQQDGIEAIPASQLPNCSAVYHDGFYKLSIPTTNGVINKNQWWLDVERLARDDNRLWGPWYGPMEGMRFSAQEVQNGPGDNSEWIVGESDSGRGGFVYQADIKGNFSDLGENIPIGYQTFFNNLSSSLLNAVIHRIEFEMVASTGDYNIDYFDTVGKVRSSDALDLVGELVFLGESFYGDFFFNAIKPSRILQIVDPSIMVRFLSILIKNSSIEKFELLAIRVEEQIQQTPLGE